jgi:hypothetical protein
MLTGRRLALVLLASLILSATAPSQAALPAGRLPPPALRQIEEAALAPAGPDVTIGDGVHSSGMYTGTNEAPFVQALLALPDGGTIRVGAGTYTFSSPVVVSTASIALEGHAATLMTSADPVVGVFDVQADDVAISGFELRQDVDDATDHALVRIGSSSVRVRDCSFSGVSAAGTPQFVLLTAQASDRWIRDNVFHPAIGWTCVRAETSRGLHLDGNHLSGTGGMVGMTYGFHLIDETWAEITNNTFFGLGSEAEPVEALILVENVSGEGHHTIISGNIMHLIVARRGVHLAGAQFSVFSGNGVGRIVGSQLLAMLDIDSGPQGVGAQSVVVSGNEFHNAQLAPMVRLNGIHGANVSGNQFSLAGGTVVLVGDQETAHRVTVATNSFGATPAISPMPAVRIADGTGHVVLGNSFEGFLLGAVEMTGVPPSACVVDLNIED